jgi:type II restriction enzyme
MPPSIQEAKDRLDRIISISRVDWYKPIQIAEVLIYSRLQLDIDVDLMKKETYQNKSIGWRNEVTRELLGKISTSSARYQHDVWSETAMSPNLLTILDAENKRTQGGVERYVHLNFGKRQELVANIIAYIEQTSFDKFDLSNLFKMFTAQPGIRRSIDKVYEIVTYSLFETITVSLDTEIHIAISEEKLELLNDFYDLTSVLLGFNEGETSWKFKAHIYRVGVTNAADRGVDMWANFGPAIQVKHLTLDQKVTQDIVDQVESDHITPIQK